MSCVKNYSVGVFILLLCVFKSERTNTANLPFQNDLIYLKYSDFITKSAQSSTLKCVSYNAWGLPVWLKGHNQSSRFSALPDSLLNLHQDIICLQECFHPVLRHKVLKKLTKEYYFISDYYCNQDIFGPVKRDCFGGLMTFSKFPIIYEKFFAYSKNNQTGIIENIGNKGFLFTVIDLNGTHINIINTHLYAGNNKLAENQRMLQIKQMFTHISSLPEFYKNPTLLMGDINITHPDVYKCNNTYQYSYVYDYILEQMGFVDSKPSLTENDYTYNGKINQYVKDTTNLQKLDYCFIYFPNNKEVLNIKEQGTVLDNYPFLSDHMGWQIQFEIRHEPSTPVIAFYER